MEKLSYKDGIFLNRLCEYLVEYVDGKKDVRIILERLKKYTTKIEKKANGYWKLPKGKKVLIEALNAIILILSYRANGVDIKAINYEFTNILTCINSKCRITFLAQEYSLWASFDRLYKLLVNDFRFEVKVVYVPFFHKNASYTDNNIELYQKAGIQIINYDKYDLSEDNPDIVFFAKPYSLIPQQFYITEIEKIVDKTVYIPYGMEASYNLLTYSFCEYLHYRVWRHIVHGPGVKLIGTQYGYRNGENIVVWGHPKMDYYLSVEKSVIPKDWIEKINGRKVVCWCPHHTILPGKEHSSTWLDYQEIIFEWFDKHKEVFLLWRPHPLLFGAIVNNGYMTQDKLNDFLSEKEGADNIILDMNGDYHPAFECSYAMITDGTTFSVEYLGTGNPLMMTTNDITSYYNYEDAQKGLYIGDSKKAVIEFLENVSMGYDPKRKLREEYAANIIFYPKGKTISEYIVENLLKDLVNDQEKLARRLCE